MKTMMKTIAVLAGLLVLSGCTASAQDATATATPTGFGPGWRHEQMIKARQNGDIPVGPAMMGRGFGPGAGPGYGMRAGYGPPVDADGKVDVGKMPDFCPYKQAVTAPAAK